MPYIEDRKDWFEGQGLWEVVPEEKWNDWKWQVRNRITSLGELEVKMELTDEEREGCRHANEKLAMAITPYFFQFDRSR